MIRSWTNILNELIVKEVQKRNKENSYEQQDWTNIASKVSQKWQKKVKCTVEQKNNAPKH